MEEIQRKEIVLYMENAQEMLEVARLMLNNDFYTSTINRAYYAIFYAANALLITKGLSSSKHSGVISAFRQHFVKTGHIASEYSEIYGRVMGNRHAGDYELESPITKETAKLDLADAEKFVSEVENTLKNEGWL
ncbi:MAG TPA: HEPN domain-containing protein [Anaerolineales bacterium]|nr:HEPN domain-containing protein [Anaerolineales bacterium]